MVWWTMNEPSPYRCRFDEIFRNKTRNTVSCNAVIAIQELNRATQSRIKG